MARRRTDIVVALVAVLAATACGRGFEQPDVRVAGVRLGAIGLQGGRVYVQLSVTNPNPFRLAARRLTYDLDLRTLDGEEERWVDFAEGSFDEEIRVGADATTVVEVPIDFTYSALGGALDQILRRGSFDYRVAGRIELREPLPRDVPFNRRGTVSFSEEG